MFSIFFAVQGSNSLIEKKQIGIIFKFNLKLFYSLAYMILFLKIKRIYYKKMEKLKK